MRQFHFFSSKMRNTLFSSFDATPRNQVNLGTVLLYKKIVWWNKSLHNLWLISVHIVLYNLKQQESELDHQSMGLHSYVGTANITCMHHSFFCWYLLDCNTTADAVDKVEERYFFKIKLTEKIFVFKHFMHYTQPFPKKFSVALPMMTITKVSSLREM